MNEPGQLELLAALEGGLAAELLEAAATQEPGRHAFDPLHGAFGGADAAALFAILRRYRPRQVIEVGGATPRGPSRRRSRATSTRARRRRA